MQQKFRDSCARIHRAFSTRRFQRRRIAHGSGLGFSKPEHKIVIKSFNVTYLHSACLQIQNLGQLFGFSVSSVITLPKKTKKYLVLRSPHIYKKAREQFEIRTFQRVVYLTPIAGKTDDSAVLRSLQLGRNLFFYFLSVYSPFGVSLKITSTQNFNCTAQFF